MAGQPSLPDPNTRTTAWNEGALFPRASRFAGPGFYSKVTLAARPLNLFDFTAKIHDLHYYVNNLSWANPGAWAQRQVGDPVQGDAQVRSHLYKADRIFFSMLRERPSDTPATNLMQAGAAQTFVTDPSLRLANDGFVCVLTNPGLLSQLARTPPWYMIPYSALRSGAAAGPDTTDAPAPEDFDPGLIRWLRATYPATLAEAATF